MARDTSEHYINQSTITTNVRDRSKHSTTVWVIAHLHHWLVDGEDKISPVLFLHLFCDGRADLFLEQALQVPECHYTELWFVHAVPEACQKQRQERFKWNKATGLACHRFNASLVETPFPCSWSDDILNGHLAPLGKTEHFDAIVSSRKPALKEKARHLVSCVWHVIRKLLLHRVQLTSCLQLSNICTRFDLPL